MYPYTIEQGLDRLLDAKTIRREVFMLEQGFQNEFDDVDALAYHIVVYDGIKPIATGRTYPKSDDGKTYAIGRIALIKEYRGQHLGEFVVHHLEEIARQLAAEYTQLSAQIQARGFYEKLGYASFGPVYLDEHCPHITMGKKL